ncbi:MAG: peptidase S8, partial [Chloroflexi bacterium]
NLIERISEIKASQFALGTTLGNDRLQAALVASMPLRVDSSRAHFNLPVGRTLDGRVITERVSADLSPSGRERSLELALAARAGKRGVVQFNLSRTLEAGHSEDAEPINAVVVSYGTAF